MYSAGTDRVPAIGQPLCWARVCSPEEALSLPSTRLGTLWSTSKVTDCPASLGTFSAETRKVMGKPGHVVTLRHPKDSKGTCVVALGGDWMLHGREDRCANQVFNEVSCFHPVRDRRAQILYNF